MEAVDLNLSKEIDTNKEEVILNTGSRVCSICLKEKAEYTCPRCNIHYCSLDCYKHEKHLRCSESFYKDWVMEELHDTRSRPTEKQKILEMLARVEEDKSGLDSDDDDDDEDDLENRLRGIDLDDTESVLKKLTEKERSEFDKLIQDGQLGALLEVWTPWWMESMKLIEDVEDKETGKDSRKPELFSPIPDIQSLIRVKPSSDIRYNLINVLYSYAFISRLHNGGHFDSPVESVNDLLSVCSVLSEEKCFVSLEMAIEESLQLIQKEAKQWEISLNFTISLLDDVKMIINGGEKQPTLTYMMLALSDVTRLLQSAYKILHTEKKQRRKNEDEESKKRRKLFQHVSKKCIFLLSWCQRYGMAVINLLPELDLEICRRKVDIKQVEETKTQFEKNWKGKLPPAKKELISQLS